MISYFYIKRLIDFLASFSVLVCLLPLMLPVAIMIRLESEGSPFFLQQRIGRLGKVFTIVKFRSMVRNAEQLGTQQTSDNDPRITPLGKFLRQTSIDELPQLWNVLIGDMSLIGPRPATPSQQQQYSPQDWDVRHQVRPGITGLAQVSGRSNLQFEEQVDYDRQYAAGISLKMDISIVLKTIVQILKKAGVN